VVAASLVASACSDTPVREPTAPSALRPSGVVAAANLTTLACDFTALKSDARGYAASNKDALFTIIGDLQSLSKNGPNATATSKAFDGLARLAAMRGTSAQATGVAGAVFDRLTRRLLGCMESYVVAGAAAQDFSGALKAGWMYEVRGKDGVDPNTTGAYERGAPSSYWTMQPGGPTWGATLVVTAPQNTTATNRVLVYGYDITDALVKDPVAGSAFEHRTIPPIGGALSLAQGAQLNIGLCNVELSNALRVQHVSTVLPKKTLACDAAPPFTATTALSMSSIAHGALGFFAPRPAFAAFIAGSVGGAVSELSPSAVIDMQQTTLKFVAAIADGRSSRDLQGVDGNPVQVLVTTKGGVPLPNVTVTLTVAGNNSVIAFFSGPGTGCSGACVSATSDASGIAKFTGDKLTKAGGYQLTANGSFDGVQGPSALSNAFNIQNK
jgi:hypothetical protein